MKNLFLNFSIFLSFSISSQVIAAPKIRQLSDGAPEVLVIGKKKLTKISTVTEIRFEHVKLSPSRKSAVLSFELPAGSVGFSINILPEKTQDYCYVDTLANPKGEEIISGHPKNAKEELLSDPRVHRPQQLSMNAMMPDAFKAISSTPIPNHPRVAVMSGNWSMVVASESRPITVTVVVLVKTINVPFDSSMHGHANLNLYSTSVTGWPQTVEGMKKALAPSLKFYGDQKIHFEISRAGNLDKKFDSIFDLNDQDPTSNKRFLELMTLNSAKGRSRALDVYFPQRNNYTDSGIASLNGATNSFAEGAEKFSGVVVWEGPQDKMANAVFAHELAHHLGLYHTNMDAFSDTSTFDHWLDGDQGFKANLMHDGCGEMVLSKQQLEVIRRNVAIALYKEN